MDWAGILPGESAEEKEMSILASGFAAQIQKRVADLEDDPTSYLMGSVLSSLRHTKRLRRIDNNPNGLPRSSLQ